MKRLLYLAALSMLALLILSPAASAQDVDCPQLSFEEAQAILAADPTDPNRLDQNNNGIACEANAPADAKVETKTEVKADDQKEETKAEVKVEEKKEEKKEGKKEEKKEMPKTGGAESASLLALGAGALLVGGGLLARRIAR